MNNIMATEFTVFFVCVKKRFLRHIYKNAASYRTIEQHMKQNNQLITHFIHNNEK